MIAHNQVSIVVSSLIDPKSLDVALRIVEYLKGGDFCFVIAANKADLVERRSVTHENLTDIAENHQTVVLETSAKEDDQKKSGTHSEHSLAQFSISRGEWSKDRMDSRTFP
jgi:signal recognition particle receptor subunit beta